MHHFFDFSRRADGVATARMRVRGSCFPQLSKRPSISIKAARVIYHKNASNAGQHHFVHNVQTTCKLIC